MKVAITVCIILIFINSVYNEDSNNNESLLRREKKDASTTNRKDSKVERKKKKKKRKLKKNQRKSKGNRKAKSSTKKKKVRKNKKTNAKKKKKTKKNNQNIKKNKKKNKRKKSKEIKDNRKLKNYFKRKQTKRQDNAKKKDTDKKNKSKGRNKNIKRKKGNRKKNKNKKKTKKRKSQGKNQVERKHARKMKQDNSSSTKLPKKLNCDPPNTKAVNSFKQNRRFYDKNNLLENKLKKVSIFKSYASLIGKITNSGETCTEEAKAGYLLMNGCETSAAASCSNSEFKSQYLTAIGCVQTINCDTTKIPDECKIKAEKIVDKTKECTNKNIAGTYSYCMSYIKENISTVISDCLDEILKS